ncbi:MAG: tetratricopeptide repeat protein [Planctomycetota bacterium]
MHISRLLMVMAVVGVLLCSIGCKTEGQKSMPGALPTGRTTNMSPKLNATTYFAHGHLLERQGNFAAAVEQYQHALELNPTFATARNRLGITFNKLGQHAEASHEFRLAIKKCPTSAHLYNNLGFSLYLEGNYPEAADALREALELKPMYNRAHMNYGATLGRLGQYDEALNEFRLVVGEPDAYYNIGVLQTDAGDYATAAHSLETALRLKPDFDVARQQLHQIARLAAETETVTVPEAAVAENPPDINDNVNLAAQEETATPDPKFKKQAEKPQEIIDPRPQPAPQPNPPPVRFKHRPESSETPVFSDSLPWMLCNWPVTETPGIDIPFYSQGRLAVLRMINRIDALVISTINGARFLYHRLASEAEACLAAATW